MTHKLALLFTLLLIHFSCSQEGKKEKNMEELNSSNYVEYMLKHVKHYETEPTYWLRIEKDYDAELEILVNDMPVFKDYNLSDGYGTSQDINFMILQSGVQKIRYRLSSKKPERTIGIRVVELDKKGPMKLRDEKLVKDFSKTIQFPSSGIYEEEFTFEATVPYQNRGWSDGQDLTKFDRKELESAVVAFYRKMWSIFNDRDKEAFYALIKKRDTETSISDFEKEEGLAQAVKDYNKDFELKEYHLQPLRDYKMVLYGDGKVVCLKHTTMDPRLRGKLALWAKYQYDGEKTIRSSTPNLYLYLPPGKDLKDGLEIIR